MKKYCKALVNLGVAFIILLLIVFLVPKLLVFFAPFVAGWIIALIASPLVRFFEEKLKIKRKAGSAFVIVAVIALVILILYLVGAKLTDEIMGLIGALPDIWDSAEHDFADIGQNLSVIYNRFPVDVQQSIMDVINQIGSYVADLLGKIGTPTINAVGNFAKQVPSILIGLIMALLSSYFFVAERDQLAAWFRKHTPAEVLSWYYMLKRGLVKAVGGYLKAQLKIEVWMYLLLVIGFAILQVDYALLIALGIAFLDFLRSNVSCMPMISEHWRKVRRRRNGLLCWRRKRGSRSDHSAGHAHAATGGCHHLCGITGEPGAVTICQNRL